MARSTVKLTPVRRHLAAVVTIACPAPSSRSWCWPGT